MGNDDHRELAVERRLELLARADSGGDGDREGLHHRVRARARHVDRRTLTHGPTHSGRLVGVLWLENSQLSSRALDLTQQQAQQTVGGDNTNQPAGVFY